MLGTTISMKNLQEKAIEAALNFDWELVVDYNLTIITESPNDLQALNRLARGYMELGQKDQTKEIYEKVLKIDKFNPIAIKNLKLLPRKNGASTTTANEDFIEETGITKTTKLIKLAGKDILGVVYCKQPLQLYPKSHLVSITTPDNAYIGSLPDDLSFKIIKLMQKGYIYTACIKSVTNNEITIFIRETKRGRRGQTMPSFCITLNYQALKR